MDDPHDLSRFVEAQDPVYSQVTAELDAGAKSSHWMWFVFPQLAALGRSATAKRFGIASMAEAEAYWRHPVLGRRLQECCHRLLRVEGRTAREIFGTPDDLKLRSCMTLFERAAPDAAVFGRVLDRYCAGARDAATLRLL
jgi:uncharacterized protein (DUF1810 family)